VRHRALNRLAAAYGFAPAEHTRRGHLRFRHASGAVVFAASTPSDRRAWRNTLALFRRVARGGAS
jgi:hypothetical protein